MFLHTLEECPHSPLSSPHLSWLQSTQSGFQPYSVERTLSKIKNEKLQSLIPELVCPLGSVGNGSPCPLSGNLTSSGFPKTSTPLFFSPHSWELRTNNRELKTSSSLQPWEWNLTCESVMKRACFSGVYTLRFWDTSGWSSLVEGMNKS